MIESESASESERESERESESERGPAWVPIRLEGTLSVLVFIAEY